jgi:hypothetical protein
MVINSNINMSIKKVLCFKSSQNLELNINLLQEETLINLTKF